MPAWKGKPARASWGKEASSMLVKDRGEAARVPSWGTVDLWVVPKEL